VPRLVRFDFHLTDAGWVISEANCDVPGGINEASHLPKPAPKRYDNRWIVFPQDFPSGGRLVASGIRECGLLTDPARLHDDLCHVLRRWQDAGVGMFELSGEQKRETSIPIPPWYRQVFSRMVALSGLKPNSYGGFGALIPEPSQSGFYG
jgi:hypothetical protein